MVLVNLLCASSTAEPEAGRCVLCGHKSISNILESYKQGMSPTLDKLLSIVLPYHSLARVVGAQRGKIYSGGRIGPS